MSALKRSTRRKIFYAMVAFFAIVAPLTLLYSQGYIFDLKSRGFISTGGVFVKTSQTGVRVSVDSQLSMETSFISRGALITNLLPRRYTVRAEKDGYQPWAKTIRVASEEVIEFRNVILPLSAPEPRLLFEGRGRGGGKIESLPGRSEIAFVSAGSPFSVSVIEPETRRVIGRLERVMKWSWDERSQAFIVGRFAEDRMRWYRGVFAAGRVEEIPIVLRGLPHGFSPDRVIPHPKEKEWFYFSAGGALFMQGRAAVPVAIAEQIHSFTVGEDRLYFITKNGFFAESDLSGGNTKLLGRKGLLLDDAMPALISAGPGGDIAVLDAADGLFIYRPGISVEIDFIAGGVDGIYFSEDGTRMLFWDGRQLSVYWLRDNQAQPFDLAGTKKQFFSADEPVLAVHLNKEGTYAFYATANKIGMVELDDRAGANNYDIIRSAVISFAAGRNGSAVYWLEKQSLYSAKVR